MVVTLVVEEDMDTVDDEIIIVIMVEVDTRFTKFLKTILPRKNQNFS